MMNRIARRTNLVILLTLVLVAGLSIFVVEYVQNAETWATFTGSPHVYNGSNIGCGAVTDREGVLILDLNDTRTYSSDPLIRASTVHWVGDRKGSISAPALSHYAPELVGYSAIDGLYHYGGEGGVAELTFSADVQKAALEAMGGQKGTVAVYNYKTGQILCAVTTPTYDPDQIPDVEADTTGKYEGLYVNRFTRSVYVPGSIFKCVTMAAALETVPDLKERTFTCTGAYTMGVDSVTCESAHGSQNYQQAFRNSCNCAFAQITELLGGDTLTSYVEKFGVVRSLEFDGITTAAGNYDIHDAAPISVAWSGIGQYTDQINPCAFLTYIGTIAGGGQGALPHVVEKITLDGKTTYQAETARTGQIMSGETAQTMRLLLRSNVEEKYGADNFPGLTVCAKTGTAQVGGDKKSNAMFTGFVADEEYPLAFIVCVEDYGYGRECIPIAARVLAACKAVLDG